jgi:DNA-binding SARP family transcriptional activator
MLRINALGGLFVAKDGRVLAGAAAQPRRLAILGLLARAGDRGMTRDKLMALLWPDADEERGRKALTQALYALRQDFGAEEAVTGVKDLRLNPELVQSDVGEFTEALAHGQLERAVACYGGPFLDGFHLPGADEFERWVETEQSALSHDYGEVLRRLAPGATQAGDLGAAVGWWKRLAAHDPLDSRTSLALMKALAAVGDRGGALQHARIHEALLEQHLDRRRTTRWWPTRPNCEPSRPSLPHPPRRPPSCSRPSRRPWAHPTSVNPSGSRSPSPRPRHSRSHHPQSHPPAGGRGARGCPSRRGWPRHSRAVKGSGEGGMRGDHALSHGFDSESRRGMISVTGRKRFRAFAGPVRRRDQPGPPAVRVEYRAIYELIQPTPATTVRRAPCSQPPARRGPPP